MEGNGQNGLKPVRGSKGRVSGWVDGEIAQRIRSFAHANGVTVGSVLRESIRLGLPLLEGEEGQASSSTEEPQEECLDGDEGDGAMK